MNRLSFGLAVLAVVSIFSSSGASAQSWQARIKDELPIMGHRNWVLIVDSAYPEQVGAGIETIETNSEQLEVVRTVLADIKNSIHVRPLIFMDAELPFVPEKKAPGVSDYREQVKALLHGYGVSSRLHQSLIDEIAKDSAQYHVLILKTNLTIRYTSVFIHLDCKYWGADEEQALREAMASQGTR